MTEFFSQVLKPGQTGENSVFFILLVVSFTLVVMIESRFFIRFLTKTASDRGSFSKALKELLFGQDPKAPLVWAFVPFFFFILILPTEWNDSPGKGSEREVNRGAPTNVSVPDPRARLKEEKSRT